MARSARLPVLLLLAAALVLAACQTTDEATLAEPGEPGERGEPAFPDEATDFDDGELAFDDQAVGQSGRGAAPPEPPPAPDEDLALPATTPPQTGDRIIKEGTMSVEVEVGEFDRAFAAVVDAATRLGGTVVSSTTRTGDDDRTSGSVTVRVPVHAYEELLVGVGDIGKVRARQITARDVSSEFVDLQSRLRHLQALERFYIELMEDAETVGDAIAVQQHLQQVQQQMEQIQGRIQHLDERTTYSTLTVELLEPGTEGAGVGPLAEGRPDLGLYWERARDAFVNMVGNLLVAALFLLPLLIPAAAGLLAWRLARRRSAVSGTAPQEHGRSVSKNTG